LPIENKAIRLGEIDGSVDTNLTSFYKAPNLIKSFQRT